MNVGLKSVLFCCLAWVSLLGCSGRSIKRYSPATGTARQALEASLAQWKSGSKHGPITSFKPPINVFDARWAAGSKLESYEILEEVPEKQHPQFKVRLKLSGKAEETNEYLVVGIDPLLIFRDSDYQRATGM